MAAEFEITESKKRRLVPTVSIHPGVYSVKSHSQVNCQQLCPMLPNYKRYLHHVLYGEMTLVTLCLQKARYLQW